MRRKTKVIADETLRADEAFAPIEAAGKHYEAHIPHASGTAANPMRDAAIAAKFLANATPVIGNDRAERVVAFVWTLERRPGLLVFIGLLALRANATRPQRSAHFG